MRYWIKLVYEYSFPILIFYTTILIISSLHPRLSEHYQSGEMSSGLIPKEGDNFKMANNATVYRLENGKRRQYKNSASFFCDKKNKPYETTYEEGGILICDKAVVASFPIGNYMPEKVGGIGKPYEGKSQWKKIKENLFKIDKLGHLLAYLLFAILLFFALKKRTSWSLKSYVIIVLVLGTVLGGGIEWIQLIWVSGRNSELLDLVFNNFGLIIGLYIASKQEVNLYQN